MILPLRFLQVVAIFMVPLLCAAPALGVLNEESDEDVLLGPVAAEVPGPESYESLLRDMMEKIEQGIEAKKHLIRIEALTLCPTEDIRDRLEQQQEDEREDLRIPSRGRHLKWRWCEDTPKLVYPSGAVPHWDFDALYTMNWTNVDDGCPQVFRWTTKKCGQLNKSEFVSLQTFPLTCVYLVANQLIGSKRWTKAKGACSSYSGSWRPSSPRSSATTH